jgi:hypothetical protein
VRKILVKAVGVKNLFVEATVKTPQIDLNYLNGELIISGRSIPENAAELYESVLKWVHEYILNPRQITNLRLNLEYFNTSSSIWIAKTVKALSTIKNNENTVIIHLYFNIDEFNSMDSEDIRDALSPVVDIIGSPSISIGIKIYGTDPNGQILKESMVLI